MNFRRIFPSLKTVAAAALVLTAIITTSSIAGADSVGTSPIATPSAGIDSGTGVDCTGSVCTIQCTSNGGASTANYTYANPFPWCTWDTTAPVSLTPPGGSGDAFCATGFYAWNFYGTVTDPSENWNETRVPINNDCPTVGENAWVMSPSPLDANQGDTAELEPLKWASGPSAGQQQTETPLQGATLWDLKGEPAPTSTSSVYYAPASILTSTGTCSSLITQVLPQNIASIATGLTNGVATDTAEAAAIWSIYNDYKNNFPDKVTSPDGPATYVNANIKVGLPEYYPPVTGGATGLVDALNTSWGGAQTWNSIYSESNKYGPVFPCSSVLQYSSLSTAAHTTHRIIGSCIIATDEQEFGVSSTSDYYGAAPVKGPDGPMGGNRVVTTGDFSSTSTSTTDRYSTAEPPDPDITTAQYNSAFSSWRSTIDSAVGSETYSASGVKNNIDYPFMGPSYNVGTVPPNAETNDTNPSTPAAIATAASQVRSHALCTIDTPPPTITPPAVTPTTTTTKPQPTTTTTIASTTPTTIDGPAGVTPMQTMTAFIPVFADGGSLRPQTFTAKISAFSTAQCNDPSQCHVSSLGVTAKITGTNGYSQCATQSSTHCDFYVISTPTAVVTNAAQTLTWEIDFLEPTTPAQHVDITLFASGQYIDYHYGVTSNISERESVAGNTAKTCAANDGTFSGRSCYKIVEIPVYGWIANPAIAYPLYAPGLAQRVVTGALPES